MHLKKLSHATLTIFMPKSVTKIYNILFLLIAESDRHKII